jgi:ubiquinone/menaquinone biosynthesis C-methylase UbiE
MKLDHFGWIAPWYDRYASVEIPSDLLRLVDAGQGSCLLDAGGGTGRIAQAFAGQGVRVYVADISPIMARLAIKKEHVRAVCAAAEEIPFPTGFFDRIIMVDAFHHVISQKNTVEELWRVLKPGGRMVIEEPDIRTSWVKLIAVAEKILLMRSHFLPPEKIMALFKPLSVDVHMESKDNNAWVVVNKSR